jgi:hypothetical protein
MACTSSFSYYVRVNKVPPDAQEGVLLYTKPPTGSTGGTLVSKPVSDITFSGKTMLCFSEDPSSTVTGLHIDIAQCANCQLPPVWDGQVMMVVASAPSPGSGGGALALKAQEMGTGTWHSALTNPPGIDGGRPIIRNTFNQGIVLVAIALIAIGVIYMLAVFAKKWSIAAKAKPGAS